MAEIQNSLFDFIEAACVPLDAGHTGGTLDEAEAILRAHPDIAHESVHAAAILGDDTAVQYFLALDPESATTKGGPREWDALTYLCFSRFLRLDRSRSYGFVRSATALMDAGASANTGWYEINHQPQPVWESALYGAAGVAHHPELTRLLLERGADPNDDEVPYHAPEGWDNEALEAIVETGRLTADSQATILSRKTDWHDYEGIRWLLERGFDPNRITSWGKTALHNALLRDNAFKIIEVLLDHKADPTLEGTHPEVCRSASGKTAISLAVRRGRGDVLELFEQRGFSVTLQGVENLIVACARNDIATISRLRAHEPSLLNDLRAEGAKLLAEFAGNGNTEGVRHLLDLGIDVNSRFAEGDGYFEVARNSSALHVAAWRARYQTVKLLIEYGAEVDSVDEMGRTPLSLAVRACVDSYWTERRSPESVRMLLEAGASVIGVPFPSGYSEVDSLLKFHGAVA